MDVPEIIVTDRSGAGRYLLSPSKGGHIKYVVSIGTGEDEQSPPEGLDDHPAEVLRLEFQDIELEYDEVPLIGGSTFKRWDHRMRMWQGSSSSWNGWIAPSSSIATPE